MSSPHPEPVFSTFHSSTRANPVSPQPAASQRQSEPASNSYSSSAIPVAPALSSTSTSTAASSSARAPASSYGAVTVSDSEDEPLLSRRIANPPPSKYVTFTGFLMAIAILLLGGYLIYLLYFVPPPLISTGPKCEHPSSTGTLGMVSTTNEHATTIGLNILKAGGNAVDAAVAVQFALSVVTPQSTSIGGGCFLLYYHASSKTLSALDGREEAPAQFNRTSFCKNPVCQYDDKCDCSDGVWPFYDRVTGGHPVGVPGVIRAMERALREHGTLTLAEAMRPAIELARTGFPVYDEMYARLIMNRERMIQFEGTKKLYFTEPGDMPIPIGQTFTNPDLANTLQWIGDKGIDVFYSGAIAKEIVETVQSSVNPVTKLAGSMQISDLESYRAVYRRPVHTTYRGYDVYSMPSPSSGGIALMQALNMLENFDMPSIRPTTLEYLHHLIDVQDLAFADRDTYLADADWVDVPARDLLNKSYARSRLVDYAHPLQAARKQGTTIPSGTPSTLTQPWEYAGANPSNKAGTTHLVVADSKGNIVTMTTTIEENFGSGVVVPHRGFLLNNELTDFEPLPYDAQGRPFANAPEPGKKRRQTALGSLDMASMGGKRPLSSMAPTMVFHHGAPYMAIGSPGGSRIIGTVLNALVNVIDGGLCLGDAIAAARALSRNAAVEFEPALMNHTDLVSSLQNRGFEIVKLDTPRPMGYVEAIRFTDQGFEGSADITRMPNAAAEGY